MSFFMAELSRIKIITHHFKFLKKYVNSGIIYQIIITKSDVTTWADSQLKM